MHVLPTRNAGIHALFNIKAFYSRRCFLKGSKYDKSEYAFMPPLNRKCRLRVISLNQFPKIAIIFRYLRALDMHSYRQGFIVYCQI